MQLIIILKVKFFDEQAIELIRKKAKLYRDQYRILQTRSHVCKQQIIDAIASGILRDGILIEDIDNEIVRKLVSEYSAGVEQKTQIEVALLKILIGSVRSEIRNELGKNYFQQQVILKIKDNLLGLDDSSAESTINFDKISLLRYTLPPRG